MSSFDKAWRIVKEDEHGEFCDCSYCHIPVIDEGDKWSREYEEAHARGDQETMDRMNAENEAMEEDLLMDDPDYRDKLNREMGDNDPQNACPSCGFYRYPENEYCRECFDGATPKDRNNPNPHPLDGMLDDSFASANEAYSLWDEGYEPDYNSVVEAARNVLEAMGYQVIAPPSEEADSAAAMRSAKIGSGTASFDDLMADRDQAISDGKDLREHYRN
jgi:hypothetical protein